MGYKENFQLGNLVLPNNIFYAPLAGCSDFPFRKMVSEYRPGLIFCEMVKMDALIRHEKNTYRLLDYDSDMHPIGAQICGSNPKVASDAAKIIEDLGFDVIDLNCGCPVDKITKDGSGSAMLKTPELIGDVIDQMCKSVSIPVTVKIRAGWNEESINAPLITEIAEQAQAKAIAIHGRTRVQGYKGEANWDFIKEAKQRAKNIKVIGNGDIFDVENAKSIFSHTDCDAILLSRGSMGQPWLVEDIRSAFLQGKYPKRNALDLKKHLLQHFQYILQYQNEKKARLDMRRVGCWYLKYCQGTKEAKNRLNQCQSTQEVMELIHNFSWNEVFYE